MKSLHYCICFLLAVSSQSIAGELQLPTREQVLDGLRVEHPRLMATKDDFTKLKALCKEVEQAQQWRKRLEDSAERLIKSPPVEYEIPDGKRLLKVSRRAKDRVLLLGLMYQLTGDRRFAERAWIELDKVTHFKDWNPSHFLDTAEMTFTVAIGYDWLHDIWNEQQREQLRDAIKAMGLEQGLPFYRKKSGWSRSMHNWNQVCNGGMGVGALAIADEDPELASEVLHGALHSLPLAMRSFRPDGGWGEGPGYWRYATEYNVYFLAALRTALEKDFGLAEMPGFPVTGNFPIHFTGPTGMTFNYADAHDGWKGAPQLFWLATTFDQPKYAAAQIPIASARPTPLDLFWGSKWLARPIDMADVPRDRYFSGVSVVTFRSAWNDPNAVFVGFKGGDNRVNHGQLDLGTFVLNAAGVRWAIDLGPDDYNIPGYFGGKRWSYYRNRTEGHNTLVVNGKNQSTSATASIVRFGSSESGASAVADLSAGYPDVIRAWRGIALLDRRHVLVQDEIEANDAVEVAWHMHTAAKVEVDNHRATLTHGQHRLHARILSPSGARFEVIDANTEQPQRPLNNVRRITATLSEPTKELRLVIVLTTDANVSDESIRSPGPLNLWPNQLDAKEPTATESSP